MNNPITTYFQYQKYILLVSQTVSSLLCLYFIYHVNHYEISWNLMISLFPSFASIMNEYLATLGTLILIIPLTIIILSRLFPDIIILKIIGGFFGIAGTLWAFFKGFFNHTLGEAYNLRVLLVHKILTLEEKKIIFFEECKTFMEVRYIKMQELYKYLNEQLSLANITLYEPKLTLLREKTGIKIYAQEVVENLAISHAPLSKSTASINPIYIQYIVYGVIAITVVVLGFAIIRYFWEGSTEVQGAILMKDTATLGAKQTDIVRTTQQVIIESNNALVDNITVPAQLVGDKIITATEAGFKNTEKVITVVVDDVKNLQDRMSIAEQSLHSIFQILKEKQNDISM